LQFADDFYLDHESWIRPAISQLGDVRGLRVLDYGCGHAMAAVVLARLGAIVTAFDLSAAYVREARARVLANKVSVQLLQAEGERLPFADAQFDRVWGNAILHHLDPETAARQTRRVLRSGGRAVFCEPWAENRFLNWARNSLSYAGKERTADERPLDRAQIGVLRRVFAKVELRGFQFVSMARRVVRLPRLARGLDWCDEQLLRRVPALQNYCRYMVITLHR
jgi:ubiquinone/menaquinone biosynthesis C-methylase UbiE